MRTKLVAALVTVAVLACLAAQAGARSLATVSAAAHPTVPAWCDAQAGSCTAAVKAFAAALVKKYGNGWSKASIHLEGCPAFGDYTSVQCFVYFRSGATYRFVEGEVGQKQAAAGTATISPYGSASWKRAWRGCSLHQRGYAPLPGTLESNEPCSAMPLDALYSVADEMNNAHGGVRFVKQIGWQFTDSAYFLTSMRKVELADCSEESRTITCSDAEGDSLRYTFPG
jgi:hypothetical protein